MAAAMPRGAGGFRTAYEFKKWVMGGGKSVSSLPSAPRASNQGAYSTLSDQTMATEFFKGLSTGIGVELKKMIDGYKLREEAMKKQLEELRKNSRTSKDKMDKKRATDIKKEDENIKNLRSAYEFNQSRGSFNKKVMGQYQTLKGYKPTKEQEKAYWMIFERISQLTGYAKKKDITHKDMQAIRKLENEIEQLSTLLGPNLQKKLDKYDKKEEHHRNIWYKSWKDYKEDMSLFKDKVLDGITGIGKRMVAGFLNFGIGPVTIGRIAKLVFGSMAALGWAGGAALSGLGAGAKYLNNKFDITGHLGRGASFLGKKAWGAIKPIGQKIGGEVHQGFKESGGDEAINKLVNMFGGFVRNTATYREKMLGNFTKQIEQLKAIQKLKKWGGKAGAGIGALMGMLGGIFGGAKKMIGGVLMEVLPAILKGVAALFGGIAASALGVLGKIGGVLARFILGPAGLVLGAAAGGYAIGTALYKAFDTEILDGIEWVVNGFNKTIEWFQEKWEQLKGIYKTGKDKLSNAWKSIKGIFGFKDEESPAGKEQPAAPIPMGSTPSADVASNEYGPANVATAPSVVDKAAAMTGSSTGGGSGDAAQPVGQAVQTSGDVDLEGLNPMVRRNLNGMAREYERITGKKLRVTSGKRTMDQQAKLYAAFMKGQNGGRPAAPPGRSLHEQGYALDIDPTQADDLQRLGLLGKYQFERRVKNDPVHIAAAGSTAAALKAGMSIGDGDEHTSNTTSTPQAFQTEQPLPSETGSDTETSVAQKKSSGGMMAINQKVGVDDVKTFSTYDDTLLAFNLGVFAG